MIAEGTANTKLRGGYYTPNQVADFLAEWAIQQSTRQVLEPSCGDGNLVAAAVRRLSARAHLTGVELFPEEAERARNRVGPQATIVDGDIFSWYKDRSLSGQFDAVVGNPPFIRYQHFPESHRQAAFDLMRCEGLSPSRLTNAWVPFVVLATNALRAGGRLAMVLPAELLQVSYAGELREYLARSYSDLTIITFRHLVFDGIQQETILVLGVRQANAIAQIKFHELDDMESLLALNGSHDAFTVDLDHAREKWTQYYLSASELGLVRDLERSRTWTTLGALAEIDVGVVTGRNEFFVMRPSEAQRHGLREWCIPLVGKSAQIPGLVLTRDSWQALVDSDSSCLLLTLDAATRQQLARSAAAYVSWGEDQGFHAGYKCRIRQPRWWRVPSRWVPNAFLLRQIYDAPRIVLNRAGAICTDTIHRVRTKPGVSPDALAAASLNTLTAAFAEIRGRSYGGGVLELEPTEAEHLPFPRLDGLSQDVRELDRLFVAKGADAVRASVDEWLLVQQMGLSRHEVVVLRGIWEKLSQRRIRRPRRRTTRLVAAPAAAHVPAA